MLLYNLAIVLGFFCLFQNVLILSPPLVSDKQNGFLAKLYSYKAKLYSYSFNYQRRPKQIAGKFPGESKIGKKKKSSSLSPHPIHTLFRQPFPCLLYIEIYLHGKFATDCDLC